MEKSYKIKKSLIIGLIVIGIVVSPFLAFKLVLPYMHDRTQAARSLTLTSIPLPEKTTKVEQIDEIGQLSGNGDHCDYLTAIMLKTDLLKSEVESYYKNNYKGESTLDFFSVDEPNNLSVTGPDAIAIHPLKKWFTEKSESNPTNVVIFIFDSGITSSLDSRCS